MWGANFAFLMSDDIPQGQFFLFLGFLCGALSSNWSKFSSSDLITKLGGGFLLEGVAPGFQNLCLGIPELEIRWLVQTCACVVLPLSFGGIRYCEMLWSVGQLSSVQEPPKS